MKRNPSLLVASITIGVLSLYQAFNTETKDGGRGDSVLINDRIQHSQIAEPADSPTENQAYSALRSKTQLSKVGALAGGAGSYLLRDHFIDRIRLADKGEHIELPNLAADGKSDLSGLVFMVESVDSGAWLRGMTLDGLGDAVLTVSMESNGRLAAMIFSRSDPMAWQGEGTDGRDVNLERVIRSKILPECAAASNAPPIGEPTDPQNGISPLLESLPGASHVLYMDFDGEEVSGTTWNLIYGDLISAQHPNLSSHEILQIWKEVSEDFRPFEVNVTTDRKAYEAAEVKDRMALIVTPTSDWYFTEGSDTDRAGAAFLGSFGKQWDQIGWVFPHRLHDASDRAIVCSHEFGHGLGLHHDGATGVDYFAGAGSPGSETSWAPIMGAGYGKTRVTWSLSDYPNAFNVVPDEDDVAVLRGILGGRADEDDDAFGNARDLRVLDNDTAESYGFGASGVISNRSDVDWFLIDLSNAPVPGHLAIDLQPFASGENGRGSNLDIKVELLSASGVLQSSNPLDETSAEVSIEIESGSLFYLAVEGIGKETTNGYSDYGSLGCYWIEGQYYFADPPVVIRNPTDTTVTGGETTVFNVTASGAKPLQYQWQHRQDQNSSWNDIGTNSAILELDESSVVDSGEYRVIVSNRAPTDAISDIAKLVVREPQPVIASYLWQSFVGLPGGPGSADGTGGNAAFNQPTAVVVDTSGNVLVADTGNSIIRKISPTGVVTTVAGFPGQIGTADGVGDTARFESLNAITIGPLGNIFASEGTRIRMITPDGVVTTLALTDGAAKPLPSLQIGGLFADRQSGNLFMANRSAIYKVSPRGVVTHIAGSPNERGSVDGFGSEARFDSPRAIVVDPSGNILVSERRAIRKVTPGGVVSTLEIIDSDLLLWGGPKQMAIDDKGTLYITVGNGIEKISSDGSVSRVAGVRSLSQGIDMSTDGAASDARFDNPIGLAFDSEGNLFVADSRNHSIRKVTLSGIVTTFAGSASRPGLLNDSGLRARFNRPIDITIDESDNLFVVDAGGGVNGIIERGAIRRVSPRGAVTTVLNLNNDVPLRSPEALAITLSGRSLYVAETDGFGATNRFLIMESVPNGDLRTLAGGPGGTGDGTGSAAQFGGPTLIPQGRAGGPRGMDFDAQGNLWLTDGYVVRRMTPQFEVETVAGNRERRGFIDGPGTEALFARPAGIVVHDSGELYVTDSDNNVVRKVMPSGEVTTFAGSISRGGSGESGSSNGIGNLARFNSPHGITLDRAGNFYVADKGNFTIRKISAVGEVTTIGGLVGVSGWADGVGSNARFGSVSGIAVNSKGEVFVCDYDHNRIVKGIPLYSDDGPAVVSKTDTDGDGQSDLDELAGGTSPSDSGSDLSFSDFEVKQEDDGGRTAEVSFPAAQGVIYRIEFSSDLKEWETAWGPETPTQGLRVFNVKLDLSKFPFSHGTGFFRIAVVIEVP